MTAALDSRPVYLDYAATTPLAPEALAAMQAVYRSETVVGNPSSPHPAGCRAAAILEDARASIARLISAQPDEILFTSGATEANNLALRGGASFRAHRGRHVVTVATEHKAVLESAAALQDDGFAVTVLRPDSLGRVSPDALEAALRDDTTLVSIMHVNNETGVIQDIDGLSHLCRERSIVFHCDAAQSAGKLPIDVSQCPIDLLSLSAHKMYGPQGVGALYVRRRPGVGVDRQTVGGSQEGGLRAGTEPVALIAGFAAAADLAAARMPEDLEHVQALATRLWQGLESIGGLRRNGCADAIYPGIVNVSVPDVDGESLTFDLEPLCIATGSACNSQSAEPSFVLKAMGCSDLEAQGAIRLSFGRYSTMADIEAAVSRFRHAVQRLRAIAEPCADGS